MAKCVDCTYLDINYGANSSGAFWCEKKCERHLATDPTCGSYCEAYNRDYNTKKNALECANSNSGGGCYLTTIICKVLRLPDNNIYLQTIRNFRDNHLQKDIKYKKILVEYDIIGPQIAKALENDPVIAKLYFDRYIRVISALIQGKDYNLAINKYIEMTNSLKNFYGITDQNLTIEAIYNADIENSGHGKYVQKKITLQR